ncbi:unnamed protein product [marine sediment metagenome]|jgi:hypothetical protein|uniref:Uncharacterized protein n=1 Tax=marine sediment metagenome TaxID=412755 RepID=X1UCB7_9ZZZZ
MIVIEKKVVVKLEKSLKIDFLLSNPKKFKEELGETKQKLIS